MIRNEALRMGIQFEIVKKYFPNDYLMARMASQNTKVEDEPTFYPPVISKMQRWLT